MDASANSSAHSFVTNRFSAFPVCAIASDPNNVNGAVTYTYDPVGNRTQKVSTLPSGPSNYNANDQLATDTYDSNGNTTVSNGLGYVYDFENHLLQASGITYVYDGDGNRFLKTVAGVPTQYVVDEENPTGYTQVVSEMTITTAGYAYVNNVYGLERINQWRVPLGQAKQVSWYVYDGHGSVRALTDQTGAVTDTYDYDAFGNLLHSTGTTPNNYLFAGEQFDPDLHLYYNRARYLSVSTGRFWSMDTFEGDEGSPLSLNTYLFVNGEPVDGKEPSGHVTLAGELVEVSVENILQGLATTALLARSLGLLSDSDREPWLSRRDREENPGRLYAFGNSQGPSGPRIGGYNNKPGQTPDITIDDHTGLVGPEVPPLVHGASTWSNPETTTLTGWVYKVEKELIRATILLGVWADGTDAVPPGPNPVGHHTVYPAVGMKPEVFIQTFGQLPWRYVYKKKHAFPINIS